MRASILYRNGGDCRGAVKGEGAPGKSPIYDSESDKAIDMIKDDFLDSFKNMVLEHRQWQKNKMEPSLAAMQEETRNEKEGSSQDSEGAGRARVLADIKSRSFYRCSNI
ncbi:hypothetical protein JRQ81_000307 [Phrynocephalus forsythii]|uniref:Uncharacterized protein n=1 Tax=Phrynocephalus forsythii TaxID=171643 RepID=A0A9Q1B793_9SAUR|nr:hypothetical protein JRQ81_000307 [Phrynocephalus forsythii]